MRLTCNFMRYFLPDHEVVNEKKAANIKMFAAFLYYETQIILQCPCVRSNPKLCLNNPTRCRTSLLV